jgi:hypothetical protein
MSRTHSSAPVIEARRHFSQRTGACGSWRGLQSAGLAIREWGRYSPTRSELHPPTRHCGHTTGIRRFSFIHRHGRIIAPPSCLFCRRVQRSTRRRVRACTAPPWLIRSLWSRGTTRVSLLLSVVGSTSPPCSCLRSTRERASSCPTQRRRRPTHDAVRAEMDAGRYDERPRINDSGSTTSGGTCIVIVNIMPAEHRSLSVCCQDASESPSGAPVVSGYPGQPRVCEISVGRASACSHVSVCQYGFGAIGQPHVIAAFARRVAASFWVAVFGKGPPWAHVGPVTAPGR